MKGLNLLCLLVFVSAAISLACSQEVSQSETAATSGADVPTATATANLPTAAPVPVSVQPMPTAIAPDAPTPTAVPRAASRTGGGSGSLVVLGSHSAAAPSRLGPGGIGGLSLSPVPQTMAVEGSLNGVHHRYGHRRSG